MTAGADVSATAVGGRRTRIDRSLIVTPVIVVIGLGLLFVYLATQTFDTVEKRALAPDVVLARLGEHLLITALSTVVVMVIAVPIGVWLSRPGMGRVQTPVLAFAGFMQALPPFGLIVLLAFTPLGFGVGTAVVALVLASLLPVLTNTVVGLVQVDRSLIEAARGIGMSQWQTLMRVELPLAVPVVVAGVRVALVLNVGTATLATYIGAGGLGNIIDGMLRLSRTNGTLLAAALVAALALIVDWLAGLAEYAVRRRGA
jgi:osmoprotectant transport system permease protein